MPSAASDRTAATASPLEADMVEPVAIIGFSMKFPQEATNPEAFWEMLMERRSAMTEVPKDRFNLDGYYHPDSEKPGMINVKGGHMIKEDLTLFDAPFFSITPAEAGSMDPQQRWLLETSFRALENAGIPMEKAAGTKTSVHVGCWTREYDAIFQRDQEMQAKYQVTGAGNAMIANRVSWYFNLQGPSMAIDTACSSSLIALHLACQALRTREASMGLVGGTSLFYNADGIAPLTALGFLSPDGISYSFDSRANGYARGEGIGVLVVKLLSDALRDGDTIRAVIRATGSNQDGRTPGLTQPSSAAQEQLVRDVYASAGLSLKHTRFFEAHGTGTPVGDPLEAAAIAAVFKDERSTEEPLIVGAVKSNIGHLEGASGIAGVIKTVLVLERGVIPPNMWFEKPNPKIDPEWNLKFPTTPTPWPTTGLRRASVNSFGYGGSNAHAVLDDARHYLEARSLTGRHNTVKTPPGLPSPTSSPTSTRINGVHHEDRDDRGYQVVHATNGGDLDATYEILTPTPSSPFSTSSALSSRPLTAPSRPRMFVWTSHDEDGLRRLASAHTDFLHQRSNHHDDTDASLMDKLAYTLGCKRSLFPWRSFAIASASDQLLSALTPANNSNTKSKPVRASSTPPKLGFIFTGQGAQWHAMGRELLSVFPVYRAALASADASLKALGCSWSLLEVLSSTEDEEAASRIDSPEYSQPICAAVQIGLVDLLRSWDVRPAAVVGHSSGEIAAAYCTGAISAKAAMKAAYFRGVLSAALAKKSSVANEGSLLGMMAVAMSEDTVRAKYLGSGDFPDVAVGCVNSPKNVTLAGNKAQLVRLQALLKQEGVFCQLLRVENAYHSRFMEEIAPYYRACLGALDDDERQKDDGGKKEKGRNKKSLPSSPPAVFSSVTGGRSSAEQAKDADYWVKNMVSPVLFSQALSEMLAGSSSAPPLTNGAKKSTPSPTTPLGIDYLLEIGPHGALRRAVKEVLDAQQKKHPKMASTAGASLSSTVVSYDSLLTRNVSALETALSAAGRLFCAGLSDMDLDAVNSSSSVSDDDWSTVDDTNKSATTITTTTTTTTRMLVDLPEYPFNHSQGYWTESRISKNVRFRKHPRHDFLGTRVADWNPADARWRMYIKLSEHEWIQDHKITGKLIYPAAGMLVMALEAARQLTLDTPPSDGKTIIKGYRLREIVFDTALIVPSTTDGVEVAFHLREARHSNFASSSSSGTQSGWRDFKLCSYDTAANAWREHCRGCISIEMGTKPDAGKTTTATNLRAEQDAAILKAAKDLEDRCAVGLDPGSLYELCATNGLVFGPEFRTMTAIKYASATATAVVRKPGTAEDRSHANETVARIKVRDAGKNRKGYWEPSAEHVVHPTTLDGVLQTVFPALNAAAASGAGGGGGDAAAGGGGGGLKTVVPSFVREMWISAGICNLGGEREGEAENNKRRRAEVKACTAARRRGFREAECDVTVSDVEGETLLAELSGYRVTAVGGGPSSSSTEGGAADGTSSGAAAQENGDDDDAWRRLCFHIDWKPDVDLLDLMNLPKWFFEPVSSPPPKAAAATADGVDEPNQQQTQTLSHRARHAIHSPPARRYEDAEFVCFHFLSKTVAAVDAGEITPLPSPDSHLAKYLGWMRHQLSRFQAGDGVVHSRPEWADLASDEAHVRTAIDRLRGTPEGSVILRTGFNLPQILSGVVDPLDLMFRDDLLQEHYRFGVGADRAYARIERWVDALAHKNPALRVLEIGAGTGGTTVPVLQTLGRHAIGYGAGSGEAEEEDDGQGEKGAPRFAQYMYTDISPGFFEKARENFKDYASRMSFKVLDAEKDVVEQGFEAGTYDLVVASNVLHATVDVAKTLANTRKLLRPDGRLLLCELTNLNILRAGFNSGLLAGWWLGSEEHRRWGPLMTKEHWNRALKSAGFTGTDIAVPDWDEDRNHMTSVLVATNAAAEVVDTSSPVALPRTVIVTADHSDKQRQTADELQRRLLSNAGDADDSPTNNSLISTVSIADVIKTALDGSSLVIFLPELESPFLATVDETGYAALKHILFTGKLLWLTKSTPSPTADPASDLITGFARSVREEKAGSIQFVTLALEEASTATPSVAATKIATVVQSSFLKTPATSPTYPSDDNNNNATPSPGGGGGPEEELSERSGVLCIPRAVEANSLNDTISRSLASPSNRKPELLPLPTDPASRPLKLTIGSLGLLDTLQLVDDDEETRGDHPDLADDEVEIEVKATGLNFFDVMTALGQIPEDFFGGECAGIVRRIGSAVDPTRMKVGDRVWTGRINAFKTLLRAPASHVHPVPSDWSLEEAAALPIVYGTCIYALFDVARLKKGETLLIHSAAGGVGQAALYLARSVGAEVICTVGTDEKREYLTSHFGVSPDRIFSSRDVDEFVLGVQKVTGGKGVDVVLNSLAGEALRETWARCVAPYGRFLELGKRDIQTFAKLGMNPFAKNVMFAAVDLFYPMRHDPKLMERIYGDIAGLMVEGKIRAPGPLHVFGYGRVEEAFRLMQGGKHIGKIVVRPEVGEAVPIVPDSRPKYAFDANATYVIAGGLGGLGRSIARWMVRRGARNLLLLSRSGVSDSDSSSSSSPAARLISDLRASGCNVSAPPCDISDLQSLSAVLSSCSNTMPPIKGCIHGAMVLRDASVTSMTLAGFHAALRPKVDGSRNLNALLPRDLDFFVLLSSVAGVLGSHGQSNYTAGNTYQDALARERVARGERAVSLDLGLILSVGFVAERGGEGAIERMRGRGYMPIREGEFLALLDAHCGPAAAKSAAKVAGKDRDNGNSNSSSALDLSAQVVTGIETPASLRRRGAEEPFALRSSPLFRALHQMGVGRGGSGGSTDDASAATGGDAGQQQQQQYLRAALSATTSLPEAGAVVADALARKLAKALSIPRGDVDLARPLHAYGVDSLVAVEVRNWLGRELRADVAVFELMGGASIVALGALVAGKSGFAPAFGE